MREIEWSVSPVRPLPVVRYCKKCGRKTDFFSSGLFRVNAQKRSLDVWLIYKCGTCDSTWNDEIYSRVPPRSISGELLERFYKNDELLAESYELDVGRFSGRGMEIGELCYEVTGEEFQIGEEIDLTISSAWPLPVKVKTLLRRKLRISNKEYSQLVQTGRLKAKSGENLEKCRINGKIEIQIR